MKAAGQTLYLMISGMTFPAQSHVVNLRVTLRYADGQTQSVDLVNPFGIGDCWSTWCGRFHDTAANGFENIGGQTIERMFECAGLKFHGCRRVLIRPRFRRFRLRRTQHLSHSSG